MSLDSVLNDIVENNKVTPVIDDDEWNDFDVFCNSRNIDYRVIYDYDDGVMVSMRSQDLLSFQLWLDHGDDDFEML